MQTTQHHKNVYTDTISCVRKNGMLSDLFPIFIQSFYDWVLKCATDGTNNGITLETVISDLDYPDDICLQEDNTDDAQSLLNRVVAAAKEVGLILNASKIKCMFARTDPYLLFLESTQLENVTEFVYLGSGISYEGSSNISTKQDRTRHCQ